MNDRAKYKGRMAIYAMAGVYLLGQAYYMYKDIPTSSGTDKILMSIFMVVFAVIGAGMVIMGVTKSYKAIKEDYNAVPEEEKKDAETSEGEEAAVEANEDGTKTYKVVLTDEEGTESTVLFSESGEVLK